MINHAEANIALLYIHYIGSYQEGEGILLSEEPVIIGEAIHESLRRYFFENFKEPVFHHFTFSDSNPEMNPLYVYTRTLFGNPQALPEISQTIAKYLYDHSKHPNIKSGDLLVAYVQDVLIDDELVDAICLFKSENKQSFIKLDKEGKSYRLQQEFGINARKLDKACVIFNSNEEGGYKICALDHANRNQEARYWINDFLNIAPLSNDYYQTKNHIQATKGFLQERMQPLYETDKIQQAEYLARTKKYLKENNDFDSRSYAQEIFKEEEIINQFHKYKEDFRQERKVELEDHFAVNQIAVRNQSKVFKSVLKLDKNFHVYIHGDRSRIERGKDADGRKYYKIYYENEA